MSEKPMIEFANGALVWAPVRRDLTSIEAATNGRLYELIRSSDEVIARIRARETGC